MNNPAGDYLSDACYGKGYGNKSTRNAKLGPGVSSGPRVSETPHGSIHTQVSRS